MNRHKQETLPFIPEESQPMVEIIFSHHEHHYQAEMDWVEQTLVKLKGVKQP